MSMRFITRKRTTVNAGIIEESMKKNQKKEMRMSMRNKGMQAGLIGMLVCIGVFYTQADLIVEYNFTGGSANPSSEHSEINASSVGREGGWGIASGSGTLFIQGPNNVPTGSIDLGQYVSFEIDPLENTINYDSVSFRLGGDNTTTSIDYTVTLEFRSSLDNYTSVLGTDSYTILRNSGTLSFNTAKVIDLSGNSAFQEVGETTTFRLYAYDDSDNTTTKLSLRLDDVLVYGSVIPEPATVGMLGFGALIAVAVRRFRM